jgi:mitochondrial ATPase complex subunit ATP10
MRGVTLTEPKDEQDTTIQTRGKITLLRVYTGSWAEKQADSFISENTQLDRILKLGEGVVQRVEINLEENRMKAALVRLFMGGLRRQLPETMHSRYFLVTKGITDDAKQSLGMLNSQVGYVYLLDEDCRIRWAGCGEAEEDEKVSLVKGIARLAQDMKKRHDLGDKPIEAAFRQRLARFVAQIPAVQG